MINRSDSIMMILMNSHSNARIPLSSGCNVIYTDMFPDFCKNNSIMFNIHVSSKNNYTIRTYEHFPIKLRFLSKEDGRIIDEKVFSKPRMIQLNCLCDVQILHIFSKNHFFIANSENVNIFENSVEISDSVTQPAKDNAKMLEFSNLKDSLESTMITRDDDLSKMEENTEIKSIEKKLLDEKKYQNVSEVRKNLKEDFNAISSNQENMIKPMKEKKNNKAVSEKMAFQENLPPKTVETINKTLLPTTNLFPRKTIIIDDSDTPIKSARDQNTPVKSKNTYQDLPLLNKKITRDKEVKTTKCPICLEPLKSNSKLDICLHEFCIECIDQWSKLSTTCPICKEDFKKIIYYQADKQIEKKVKKQKFKYEEEEEEPWLESCAENCMVCNKNDDKHLLLVCDKCHYNVCHVACAGLELIPDDDWLCSECIESNKRTRMRKIAVCDTRNTRSRMKIRYSLRNKKKI